MNIKDVARIAGVSISTISRVINNSAYVSPEIRERIERVLDETGYRPNALARELLHKKTNTVGVMLPRIDLGTFAAVFDGITELLSAEGYQVLLANTHDRPEAELACFKLFYEKRVDGLLHFATGLEQGQGEALARLRLPVVVVGQSGEPYGLPAVRLDNLGAATALVERLVEQGRRRIACLSVAGHDLNVGQLRTEGWRQALKRHGLPCGPELLFAADFEYPSGEAGAARLMGSGAGAPDAIYCITDRLALAALGWLLRSGHRVPETVALACLDDPAVLSHCHPRISAMGFDYRETGRRAAKLLIDRIEGRPAPAGDLVMPWTYHERESSGGRGA